MVTEKGQKYLIESFSKINHLDWTLVILGDGPLRNELESQIELLNLKERVILLGTVNNVDEWLARASIFAFSSISEGFPNSLSEAMSAGLPCVSFDCDAGPRDLIIDGLNGFLVPLKDVFEFSKKINQLILNPDLRLSIGQEASSIGTRLDSTKIAHEYLRFLVSAK